MRKGKNFNDTSECFKDQFKFDCEITFDFLVMM